MLSKIIIIFLLLSSYCYAEVPYVSLGDVKDHRKMVSAINEVIGKLNKVEKSQMEKDKILDMATSYNNKAFSLLVTECVKKGIVANHTQVTPSIGVAP